MTSHSKKLNNIFFCGLSFIIPLSVISLAFYNMGIFPGGKYTPLILDLRAEQLPFYNYINNISGGFNSLTYQSLGGLGGGVIDSLQMCCSPLMLIMSFVNIKNIPWALWFIIICLVGLCGLTEFIYLKKGFPRIISDYKALLLSLCYALMSCMIVYTVIPVWIWGGVFLPITALGLDKIINDGNIRLFVISVSLVIVFNYYMAYVIIIFSVLYFLYRVLLFKLPIQKSVNLVFKCFASGLLSCMLSAFSWLPVLCDLMHGKVSENRHFSLGLIRNPIKVALQVLPIQYDGLLKHSLPFIYCGLISLFLMFCFFAAKNVSVREKIITGTLLIVLFLCFVIGALDIVWMFFVEPNGYPSRYSFVFSFMMILAAGRGADSLKIQFTSGLKQILKCFILILIVIELFLNTLYLLRSVRDDVGPYSDYAEYSSVADTMEAINSEYGISGGFERTIKNWRYTNDDGIFYGYPDIDYFSSSYNSDLHGFLTGLGLGGQFHMIKSNGLTPVIASVLGVKTFIMYGDNISDYYSYIGSVDDLDIYRNDRYLPVAFAVNKGLTDNSSAFHDNPFGNINTFVEDICGVSGVFEILPVESDSKHVSTLPAKDKHLWMYACPDYESSQDIHLNNDGSKYYVYYSGLPVCEYADSVSPFCVDLGVGAGEKADFDFDEGMSVDKVYMASFNAEKTNEAIGKLHEAAAYDVFATDKGMVFSIDIPENKDIMVTLPYTRGYRVYVDGVVTDYDSYMDSLILISAEAGLHEIIITYNAPGFVAGLAISFMAIAVIVLGEILKRKKNH